MLYSVLNLFNQPFAEGLNPFFFRDLAKPRSFSWIKVLESMRTRSSNLIVLITKEKLTLLFWSQKKFNLIVLVTKANYWARVVA